MPSLIKQVAHVCIFAHDLKQTEALVGSSGHACRLPLLPQRRRILWLLPDRRRPRERRDLVETESSFADANQINHICLEVHSLDEAVAAIRASGVKITDKKLGVDDTWQAWTADPNGVKIELFEYTKSAQFVGGDRVANW